ncbi:hypothetical protein KQX54_020597 [Cotesia glomerata]|uniref:Uncharacterized protein n=1 Tax=Cotesia glomerata TaxID=32391 RepID=A0AAV7I6R9_COTGL|nr:hypothetical protein KQX54_020597 [Cotesia glomerata]
MDDVTRSPGTTVFQPDSLRGAIEIEIEIEIEKRRNNPGTSKSPNGHGMFGTFPSNPTQRTDSRPKIELVTEDMSKRSFYHPHSRFPGPCRFDGNGERSKSSSGCDFLLPSLASSSATTSLSSTCPGW